ncbi:uncharacterized protein LOC135203016 [Macrobrachium nipponense]|uniref:uncharacterized protein LOC135203016 n=1 Tax=Macrobrachium nipponense TaxID=159736 RepID=UPI0030C818F2
MTEEQFQLLRNLYENVTQPRCFRGVNVLLKAAKNEDRNIIKADDIVKSYVLQNSLHKSLGNEQTPKEVHAMKTKADIKSQFSRMYKHTFPTTGHISSTLKVGDTVSIADKNQNAAFRRGYTVQNTLEISKIKKLSSSLCKILQDLAGEEIKGTFYREELIPTKLPETYNIAILGSRRRGNRMQYYVNWKGYPAQFNSWVDVSLVVWT